MQQEMIDWSKTILLVQSIMPRLLSAIDKENERLMSIGYGSRHYDEGQSTYDFLDHMLRVNVRRKNLIKLKDDVRDILMDIDREDRAILENRFFSKKRVTDLMPRMNIRTAYRRYNRALMSFAKELMSIGYDVEMLESRFGDDKVIMAVLERVRSHAVVFKSDEMERGQIARTIRAQIEHIETAIQPMREQGVEGRLRA